MTRPNQSSHQPGVVKAPVVPPFVTHENFWHSFNYLNYAFVVPPTVIEGRAMKTFTLVLSTQPNKEMLKLR